MNKFDRVISTLLLLQTKKIITAKIIAERFDVSLRTVYRDIQTLKNAGIPIIGDSGIGYSLIEGYKIPPTMFSEGEAAALLTAEKFIEKVTDLSTKAYYSSALMKIKAILRSAEKQSLEILDEAIAISDSTSSSHNIYLQDLFKCIAGKTVININYRKMDASETIRDVEPVGCYHHSNNWYLVAYCRLKKDYRTFKIDRITDLRIKDEIYKSKHVNFKEYINQQYAIWKENQDFHTIEIAFNLSFVQFADVANTTLALLRKGKKKMLLS